MALDTLLIETFAYCPHLETSGEIAIKFKQDSLETGIVFIDVDNPDDYIPKFRLLRNRQNRVKALFRVLNRFGIENCLIEVPDKVLTNLLFEKIQDEIESCNNISSISQVKIGDLKISLGVVSSYVSYMKDPDPPIDKKLVKRYLKSAIATYLTTEKVIQKLNPKKVITYNGRYACSKPIVEVCKKYSIPILYHERGATKERYYLSDKSPHDFKSIKASIKQMWELSQDENKEKIAESYFLKKIQGEEIGWVSFTKKQVKGMIPGKNKKYRWTYYSSSDDEFIYVENSMEHPIFSSQTEAIQWLISYVAKLDDVELVIRVHPHKEQKSQRLRNFWNNLSGDNVLVVPSHSPVDSYALAKSSDLVIVYSSTMGVEAAYLGKPVVVIGDATYRGLNCAYEPCTKENLETLLSRNLILPKPKENTFPFGYYYTLFGMPYIYYKPETLFKGKLLGRRLKYSSFLL